jgi:heme/copper-type cytochrome/quinol oxidase subunit 2
MEYIYFLLAICFAIYTLVDFKKKPNDSSFSRYDNSRKTRLLIVVIGVIIAVIISFFVKKN